jgi:hypothetical protein
MKWLGKTAKLLLLTGVSGVFIGCGSGGGSGTSKEIKTITGSVEASYLKNVKVCVKDSSVCDITDNRGKFELPVSYPANLELFINNYKLGEVEANSQNVQITPGMLADGNATLAGYLGTFLHYASGAGIDASVCDMNNIKNIEINASGDDLVSKIKTYVKNHQVLQFKTENKEINISLKDVDYYVTNNPLKSGLTTVEYEGAATVGDFAKFEFNFGNDVVNYKFAGNYLDSLSMKRRFVNIYNNMFFVGKNTSEFYFITRGVMVAKIVNSKGDFDIIAIPKNYRPLNVQDVAKKYNIIVKNLKIDGNSYNAFVLLSLNEDKTYSMVLKPLTEDVVLNITGNWDFKDNNVILYRNSNEFMNLTIKAGYLKNTLVADGIDGGFGLGTEAKDITKKDLKSYKYLNIVPIDTRKTKVCFGYTSEKMLDKKHIQITEKDDKCFIARSYPDLGVITFELVPASAPKVYQEEINPSISINGVDVNLSGIALGYDSEGFSKITILDADNGLYLNIGAKGDIQEASIGSNRPIN